jgi:hypothetical protein
MGLLERPTSPDMLLDTKWQSNAPADDEGPTAAHVEEPIAAHVRDVGDPLSAARGTLLAVVLGGVFWAPVLWVLL